MATARQAAKHEAENTKEVSFAFDGAQYTIPRDLFNDLDVMEALESNKQILFIKAALGLVQYAKFREKKDRSYAVDVPALVDAIVNAAVGASAGE